MFVSNSAFIERFRQDRLIVLRIASGPGKCPDVRKCANPILVEHRNEGFDFTRGMTDCPNSHEFAIEHDHSSPQYVTGQIAAAALTSLVQEQSHYGSHE